jgi:hypothetical protein
MLNQVLGNSLHNFSSVGMLTFARTLAPALGLLISFKVATWIINIFVKRIAKQKFIKQYGQAEYDRQVTFFGNREAKKKEYQQAYFILGKGRYQGA